MDVLIDRPLIDRALIGQARNVLQAIKATAEDGIRSSTIRGEVYLRSAQMRELLGKLPEGDLHTKIGRKMDEVGDLEKRLQNQNWGRNLQQVRENIFGTLRTTYADIRNLILLAGDGR